MGNLIDLYNRFKLKLRDLILYTPPPSSHRRGRQLYWFWDQCSFLPLFSYQDLSICPSNYCLHILKYLQLPRYCMAGQINSNSGLSLIETFVSYLNVTYWTNEMETIFRSRVYPPACPVYTDDWNMRNFKFPASCLHHYVFFLWGQKLLKTFHFSIELLLPNWI